MKHIKNWRFSFLIFCLVLFVTLLFPSSALARDAALEDTVGQGEILDQSLVMYGREVVMDGVINGDLLAVGIQVTINGDVNGSLVVIGQNVNLNGALTGSGYIGALNMGMGSEANAARDMYYIGASLETQEGSSINRDLHVVSLEADLSGTVGREVDALIGPVHLIQVLYDYILDQGWLSQPLWFDIPWFQRGFERQAIPGLAFGLPSFQNFMFHTANSASYSGLREQSPKQAGTIDVERLKEWAVPLLRNLVALLILGLLVIWLLPAQLSYAGEQVRKNPWRSLLTGLLVFVIGWFAALLALLIIIALAIFFYWVSLPNLGFLTGTIGLSALGIALSIFWLDIVFFSKIVVAFLCGSLFFKRFLPKYAHRRIWPFLAGVIVYALLASVPYLGWLVAVIVTFLGLGAIWKLSSMWKQPEAQVAEDAPIEADMPEASVATEA